MNFWYNFDNESHVNISNDYKLIFRELKRMLLFLNGWIGRFYSFFLQNAIGYEQDYINFLINERYNIIIKKLSKLQSNRIYFHINPLEGKESCNRKIKNFLSCMERELYLILKNVVHTMHTDNNEFDNPLKFIGYPIWHVFIRSISLLDEIDPDLWLYLDRSLYLAYEIQAKLIPDPLKKNNLGFTDVNYGWLNEIRYYCSNLQFKEIDLLFYENFRLYIYRFTLKMT
jgi:hypothetical protein